LFSQLHFWSIVGTLAGAVPHSSKALPTAAANLRLVAKSKIASRQSQMPWTPYSLFSFQGPPACPACPLLRTNLSLPQPHPPCQGFDLPGIHRLLRREWAHERPRP